MPIDLVCYQNYFMFYGKLNDFANGLLTENSSGRVSRIDDYNAFHIPALLFGLCVRILKLLDVKLPTFFLVKVIRTGIALI